MLSKEGVDWLKPMELGWETKGCGTTLRGIGLLALEGIEVDGGYGGLDGKVTDLDAAKGNFISSNWTSLEMYGLPSLERSIPYVKVSIQRRCTHESDTQACFYCKDADKDDKRIQKKMIIRCCFIENRIRGLIVQNRGRKSIDKKHSRWKGMVPILHGKRSLGQKS